MFKSFKNPVVWFAALMILFSLFRVFQDNNLEHVIRSDGRGYYAYLPALLIYNDGSFEKSSAAEKNYSGQDNHELYIFNDDEGNPYNKYFPGMAIMQLPFFGTACLVSSIADQPIDGYSPIFVFLFYLGSLFYAVAGLFLFASSIRLIFPENYERFKWLIPLFYVASPLLFYTFFSPSYSHVYSFFLFGLFAIRVIKLKSDFSAMNVLMAGAILGLIFLVRPTNLFVVFIIPFLLIDRDSFVLFLKNLIASKGKMIIVGLSGFVCVASILFIFWKWQSGHWILWSYSGEGFNFLQPKLVEGLVSYRTGLFVHTPLVLLALAGIVLYFRKSKFAASFWLIYFIFNAWIIASWWCWDYETTFGNRPFTEHLFFLIIPVVYLFARFRKITVIAIIFFAIVGGIRFWEIITGFMPNQRFTSANYVPSLAFWNPKNNNRWIFTQSCQPYGTKVKETVLLDAPNIIASNLKDDFIYTVQTEIENSTGDKRLYYRVELEKKITRAPMEGVLLVIDATNKDESKRYYNAVDLFNDRYEGKKDWTSKLIFEGIIHDHVNDLTDVKIYIWNQSGQEFLLRNVKIQLEEYRVLTR